MNKSNLIGIYWMALHSLVITFMVIIVKKLGEQFTILNLISIYTSIALIITTAYLTLFAQWHRISTKRVKIHFFRSLLNVTGYISYYYGLNYTTIASAAALSFLLPLCGCVLGIFFFTDEKLTINRIISLLIGFAGVLLIANPKFNDASWPGVAAILLSVLAWAGCDIITKKNGQQESVHGQILYTSLFCATLTTPSLIDNSGYFDLIIANYLPLFSLGILFILQVICIFKALQNGELSVVLSFDYLRLPFGLLLGFIYFGETISVHALAGVAIIITSNYFLFYSERNQFKSELSE
jgi:drug/metabolite transporter (DMT)-like permease